jgi:FtsP/CotA-like multicopper oxidase with cupredoxin domain
MKMTHRNHSTLAAACVAIACSLASAVALAQPCTTPTGVELKNPPELAAGKGVLQGTVELSYETRNLTFYDTTAKAYTCRQVTLRTYHGYRGLSVDPADRVTTPGIAAPGPTFRARVGETVQLLFLNRIDPSRFPQTSQTSIADQCDTSFSVTGGQRYPGTNEKFPNCFHAANTSNLHFHGTHVSPEGFADNVLIGVLPDPKMNVTDTIREAASAFDTFNQGNDYTQQVTAAATSRLVELKKISGSTLAAQVQSAIDTNAANARAGEWPQYWPGFYPYAFKLPDASAPGNTFSMGQSPGTHWYHPHQHGSTTLQVLNGLSGVFLIRGDYDDKLLSLGGGTPQSPKIDEKVMIFQFLAEQTNLVVAPPANLRTLLAVNGQILPKVTMGPNEVQLWRIANAAPFPAASQQFVFMNAADYEAARVLSPQGAPAPSASGVPLVYQTARDGVQFDWRLYSAAQNQKQNAFPLLMAPGNRFDFLVQAPASGTSYLVYGTNTGGTTRLEAQTVLQIVVDPDRKGFNTSLPSTPCDPATPEVQCDYPALPAFLKDLSAAPNVQRTVTFSMNPNAVGPGNATRVAPPQFLIDGNQFGEGRLDQVMLMESVEEWKIVNTSVLAHPFHIHVNPFQVVEVFDPAKNPPLQTNPQPWMWGDDVLVPARAGNPAQDGYVKIRSRFADFPGLFVLHCHILGHEDRGMMQMVKVQSNRTAVKHH